ncbi:thioredoxin M-type, chloroplastic-like [Euphorbia lathyris]|uniref:thioredoxin M-type, chloroplastic-like n=1 Tax=Euphorbia lathyris TaxID=212925 RepID=UPI003314074D
MAMNNCFQVSGGVVQYAHPFAPADHLPIYKGFNASSNLPLSSSSLKLSLRTRRTAFVCKAREAVDEVKAVTDSSWDSLVIGSETPALVEFWAPWCGPCRMIAPVIDELAKEYAGKVSCFKVNTDECPNIANKYGIRSIPTVLFFNKGEKKESVIGAVPKSTLSTTIEKYVEA